MELEEIIADLEAKLRETKPVEVAVKEGLVLEVDPVNQSVIINMGQLEGVKMGEYFTVMRIGRGAERIPKAKLKVISVKKTVSVCDIMSMVEEGDFIARRDVIHRDKKTED